MIFGLLFCLYVLSVCLFIRICFAQNGNYVKCMYGPFMYSGLEYYVNAPWIKGTMMYGPFKVFILLYPNSQ